MGKNRKRQDEIESKTESLDSPTHTDAPPTGASVRLPRRASVRVGTSACLEKRQRTKTKSEDLAEVPKEVSSSGTSISSFGTESLRTKSEENKEEISRSSERKFKILVVDDNENIRDMLEDFLNFEGHKPVLARNGKEASKIFSEQDFDIVITDLGMPGMSGWELTNHIKQRKPEIPVVIITGWGAQLGAEDLKENKVELILSKPFNLDQIKQVIETIGAKFLNEEV